MTIKDLPCGCRQRDDITAWRCAYHSGDEDGYQRGLAERDAENARLREALAVAEDGLAKRDAHVGAHKRENIKLKAENTRLREALTSIRDDWNTSHNMHWDREGNGGRTCPACKLDHHVRELVCSVLAATDQPKEQG